MVAKIINGVDFSQNIRQMLKTRTSELIANHNITPGLAVVLAGDDPASQVYVRNKARACEELGYYSVQHNLPEQTTAEELLGLIAQLNADDKIHGILVQLPLPQSIDENLIIEAIDPNKDVDAFSSANLGALLQGRERLTPCTPTGIIELIKSTNESIAGKHAVVVGRSNIVGKPVAIMLLEENATVTICHSRTVDLEKHCKSADIIVAAVGIEHFITSDHVKPGAIVIDVGINRGSDGKLYGDVDFNSVKDIAGYITPVPGGVGPMTITQLMHNTYHAALKSVK